MNMKVVVIWGFVVILFAGMGIFGFLNQDVLQNPASLDEPYVPIVDTEGTSMVCTNVRDNGNSSYRFNLDDATNAINTVNISYSISGADIDTYTSATNLNNSDINGVNITLSGTSTDFVLIITATVGSMDTVTLANYADDLSRLGIIVEGLTDYDTYKQALSSTGIYTCD